MSEREADATVPQLPRFVPVESSSVESVAYNPQSLRLYVRFRDSHELYVYYDVPSEAVDALEAAGSKGRFVNAEIKPRFRCEKLS